MDAVEFLGNLNGEKSYLVILNKSGNLQKEVNSMIDFLINKREWTCVYVNSNKSYDILKKNFEKNNLNMKRFFFIDTIKQSPKERIDNVLFTLSPSALTQISMGITQITQLTQNKGFVIIDSLEGLSINNSPDTLSNFIRSIISKVADYDSKILVLAYGGVDEKLINKISPFFDKVVKIGDEKETQKNSEKIKKDSSSEKVQ